MRVDTLLHRMITVLASIYDCVIHTIKQTSIEDLETEPSLNVPGLYRNEGLGNQSSAWAQGRMGMKPVSGPRMGLGKRHKGADLHDAPHIGPPLGSS